MEQVKDILRRTLAVVEDSRNGAMSALERDMVLENLRKAYELIRFADDYAAEAPASAVAAVSEEEEPEIEIELVMADEEEEPAEEESEESAPVVVPPVVPVAAGPTIEAEPVVEGAAVEEEPIVEESVVDEGPVAEAPTAVDEPVAAESAVPEAEPVAESCEERSVNAVNVPSQTTTVLDEELEQLRPRRSAIVSLYEDEHTPATIDEERIVGDIFRREGATSVGDTLVAAQVVSEASRVSSLRGSIGVADRFMLVRELFGGDIDAYDAAIDHLDSMSSFDDCVIYITENYSWPSSSDATKMVMSLLQRKYQA